MENARAYICIFIFIFTSIILLPIIIFIPIFLINEPPQFNIHQLHVREDSINSSNPNTSIVMDLEFKRLRATTHLRYNDVNINLSYASTSTYYRGYHHRDYVFVGYGVVPEIDMGKKKTVHREAVVVARGPVWDDALRKIADGSTEYVMVELTPKHMKTVAATEAALRIDRFGKCCDVVN